MKITATVEFDGRGAFSYRFEMTEEEVTAADVGHAFALMQRGVARSLDQARRSASSVPNARESFEWGFELPFTVTNRVEADAIRELPPEEGT